MKLEKISLILEHDTIRLVNNASSLAHRLGNESPSLRHIIISMFSFTDIGLMILKESGISELGFANLCVYIDNIAYKNRTLTKEEYDEAEIADLRNFLMFVLKNNKIVNDFGESSRCIGNDDLWIALRDMLINLEEDNYDESLYSISVQSMDEINTLIEKIGFTRDDFIKVIDKAFAKADELKNSNVLNIPNEFKNTLSLIKKEDNIEVTDTIRGKTFEIISALNQKRFSNVLVVGEHGVGKSTLISELANSKEYNIRLVKINPTTIISGMNLFGGYEDKVTSIMRWLSENNVVLVCENIPMLFKQGKQYQGTSVGELMLPYLESGKVRIIGVSDDTTYRKVIHDSSIANIFQVVNIKEPNESDKCSIALEMMHKYNNMYDSISMNDTKILEYAINVSDKYIKDIKFPSRLDRVLDRTFSIAKTNDMNIIEKDDINKAVSYITGLSLSNIAIHNAKEIAYEIKKNLENNLIGQPDVLNQINIAVRRSLSDIRDNTKPKSVMLFVGPTGVGKTETVKLLDKALYSNENNLIRIDMSEYSESHTVSKLFGAPPGYVGYDNGGQLTEQVRQHPDSIILLDEIEKANSKVFDTLLQVFDDGRMTDGRGNTVDFTNTIIIMTSNAGYGLDNIGKSIGFGAKTEISEEDREQIIKEALKLTFKPEFLNRIDSIIAFNSLDKESCIDIAKLEISKIEERLAKKGIALNVTDKVIDKIVDRGFSEEFNARNINRTVKTMIEDRIINDLIDCDDNESITKISITLGKEEDIILKNYTTNNDKFVTLKS